MALKSPLAAAALSVAALHSLPAHASTKGWSDASDIGAYALMAAAIAVPVLKTDDKGGGIAFAAWF